MRPLALASILVLLGCLASAPVESIDSCDDHILFPDDSLFGNRALCIDCGNGLCEPPFESCDNCRLDCGACMPVPCLPMPSGMVAFWPFEETSSSTFSDLINGNNAYKHGGISTTTGKVGKAAYFDGPNDYLRVPDSSDIDFGTGDFSIVMWTRVPPTHLAGVLLDKSAPGPVRNYGYSVLIGGLLTTSLGDGYNTLSTYPTSVNADDDRWHLIAFTVDRNSSTGYSFYFDGIKRLTANPQSVQGTLSNSQDLYIGTSDSLNWTDFWRGSLDELQIYKRALSSTEIRFIYNRGSSGICRPNAPGYCPGYGAPCTVDADCGYDPNYGLLGGCYPVGCICK
ncbi:MAG: LamG domain-containing protein [Acidobacteriota bacterium]